MTSIQTLFVAFVSMLERISGNEWYVYQKVVALLYNIQVEDYAKVVK